MRAYDRSIALRLSPTQARLVAAAIEAFIARVPKGPERDSLDAVAERIDEARREVRALRAGGGS